MSHQGDMNGHGYQHGDYNDNIPARATRTEPPQLYHGMRAHTCGCELGQDMGAGGDGNGDSDGEVTVVEDFFLFPPTQADGNSDPGDGNGDDYDQGQEGVEGNQLVDPAIRIPGYGCIPLRVIHLGLDLNELCDCGRTGVFPDDFPSEWNSPLQSGWQSPSSTMVEPSSMESSGYFSFRSPSPADRIMLALSHMGRGMSADDDLVPLPPAPFHYFHKAPLWLTAERPRFHGQFHNIVVEPRYPHQLEIDETESMTRVPEGQAPQ